MEKRGLSKFGQISVFIILAIVLVSAGGIAYYMSKNTGTNNYFLQSDVKPGFDNIKNSVYECMQSTSLDSLDLVGIQGGYYKEPKEFFDLGWAFIPYYYKQGSFLMQTNSEIQNQLGLYVDDNLNSCLENIKVDDFSLTYTKPKTKTIISKEEVKFTIDMPVIVKKADKTTQLQLRDNSISQKSQLYDMIDIARYITDSHKEDPNMICISCVADMARERGLYVDMLDFGADDSTTLVIVSTNKTEMYPAVYEFLNKYNAKSGNLSPAPAPSASA